MNKHEKNNIEVRIKVMKAGITYRQIAEKMGITPEHLCRLLRSPLDEKNKFRILSAIAEIEGRYDNSAPTEYRAKGVEVR